MIYRRLELSKPGMDSQPSGFGWMDALLYFGGEADFCRLDGYCHPSPPCWCLTEGAGCCRSVVYRPHIPRWGRHSRIGWALAALLVLIWTFKAVAAVYWSTMTATHGSCCDHHGRVVRVHLQLVMNLCTILHGILFYLCCTGKIPSAGCTYHKRLNHCVDLISTFFDYKIYAIV